MGICIDRSDRCSRNVWLWHCSRLLSRIRETYIASLGLFRLSREWPHLALPTSLHGSWRWVSGRRSWQGNGMWSRRLKPTLKVWDKVFVNSDPHQAGWRAARWSSGCNPSSPWSVNASDGGKVRPHLRLCLACCRWRAWCWRQFVPGTFQIRWTCLVCFVCVLISLCFSEHVHFTSLCDTGRPGEGAGQWEATRQRQWHWCRSVTKNRGCNWDFSHWSLTCCGSTLQQKVQRTSKHCLCQSKPWLLWQELLGQVALIVVSWSWPQLSIVVVYPSQLCSFTISCGVHVLDLWSWDIASLKIFQYSASLFQGELGASAISVLRLCFSRRCIQCLVAAGARLSQCLPGPQKTRNPK